MTALDFGFMKSQYKKYVPYVVLKDNEQLVKAAV